MLFVEGSMEQSRSFLDLNEGFHKSGRMQYAIPAFI